MIGLIKKDSHFLSIPLKNALINNKKNLNKVKFKKLRCMIRL